MSKKKKRKKEKAHCVGVLMTGLQNAMVLQNGSFF